jgi:curved DNA binding protein
MADKDYDSDDSEEVKEEVKEEEAAPEAPPEDSSLTNPDVVTKYQEAAKIAQAALIEVTARCVPGARLVDVCRFGDEFIEQRTQAIFKNKNKAGKIIMRGVAFPVCLSVNDVVCHCSPYESDETYPPLAEQDIVKIDLGVHVDGFIAVVAHSYIVPGVHPTTAISAADAAKRDNVISAAYTAAEVAVRLMKAGNTNAMVTAAIKQVSDSFDVRPISGTLMHQMKQFVIDANKMILLREEPEQKVDACTFEAGEVYAIDIAMSSGEGKPRETGARTTIFKRAVEKKYALKNKSSRQFFNDVNKRFPTMPFSIRSFPDEKAARMGVRECVTHELLLPYPVLNERKDDFVAHVKVTVLILPSGNTAQVTGLPPSTYVNLVTGTSSTTVVEPPPAPAVGTESAAAAVELLTPPPAPASLEGLSTKLSAAFPVAAALFSDLQARRPGTAVPAGLVPLLQTTPIESKKKAKKSSAANKKAAAAAAEAKVEA